MSNTSYFPNDDDKPEIPKGPKLSELPGLGAARLWGECLIAEFRACIAGTMRWEDLSFAALISGPPGTGKTMFASALAAELRIPIIITGYNKWLAKSGNDICVAIVADFALAKKIGRCIIFLDELDSIPSRAIDNHNTTYYTPINNTLLKCIERNNLEHGVIVIAATNHPDRLDEALKRSGRLDRHLEITLPNAKDLEEILAFHLKVDCYHIGELASIAILSVGKSGADVEKLVRDARSRARQANRGLTRQDLIAVIERDAPKLSRKELESIAFHEAGHAVAVYRLNMSHDISLSLFAPDGAGGVMRAPLKTKLLTEFHVLCRLIALLAGRAAEQKFCGEITTGSGGGAESDIAQATSLAIRAYDDLGLRSTWHGPTARQGGPVPDAVIRQAKALVDKAYQTALELMDMEEEFVRRVAQALIAKRALSHADIVALDPKRSGGSGTPPPLPPPPVEPNRIPLQRHVPMNDNYYPPMPPEIPQQQYTPPPQQLPRHGAPVRPQGHEPAVPPFDARQAWHDIVADDPLYTPPRLPPGFLEQISRPPAQEPTKAKSIVGIQRTQQPGTPSRQLEPPRRYDAPRYPYGYQPPGDPTGFQNRPAKVANDNDASVIDRLLDALGLLRRLRR